MPNATAMAMINALGTSLVAVTAFGLTTAFNYTGSGLVDWLLAGAFIGGAAYWAVPWARMPPSARRVPANSQQFSRG